MAARKGQTKGKYTKAKNSDDPESNPLLHIEDKDGFKIWMSNLINEPDALNFPEFEVFDINKDKEHFDAARVNPNSTVIIVLRYYEYICMASFRLKYVMPIMESGLSIKDVFLMTEHALKNKLLISAPSFETIIDIEIVYSGRIKY